VVSADEDAAPSTETKDVIIDGFTADNEKAIGESSESFVFQAEVNRLMDIIINSLYKNKEVFLRELISNASDALDKIRFLALSQPDSVGDTKDFEIKISFNAALKTLTIRDTGIGMTRADLINNLGTVAKSGTTNFVEALSEGADLSLIGQFGVGFYSIYLVSDRVRVTSKNNNDDQYIWESTADSNFKVAKDPRGNTLGRGTEITMFLKEDAIEFTQIQKIEELIKRYSEFITFPIYLHKEIEEAVESSEDDEDDDEESSDEDKSEEDKADDENTEDDGVEVEEEEDDKDSEEKKTEKVKKWVWERINSNVAIWSRDKDEVTVEEYQNFYKAIVKEPGEALTWIHFRAEGEVEFKSILFVPKESTGLYDDYSGRKAGVRLYVRKVLIQEDFEDLLPRYLNFIKGVVDSDDLPLNVSRETLQQHRILSVMAKKLVRKVLEMLRKLATGKDEDDKDSESSDETKSKDSKDPYIEFWEQYAKSIKMGVMEDAMNRSKLAKLLRYKSLKSPEEWTSLEQYVAGMKSWQKDIYFIAGENIDLVKNSPFLEVAKRKDVDVLFLTEPVDEYCFQHLADFDGYKLQSVTKEGLKYADEDEDVIKKRTKSYKETFKPLIKYMKELLSGKVQKVTVSQRVEKTPSVIVTSQFGNSANLERIMRSQTFSTQENIKAMAASRTLELNPRHPIVVELNSLIQDSPDEQATKDIAFLLYDTALLASGFMHDDTDSFSERMYRTLSTNLNLKSLDLAEELAVEEEAEEAEEKGHDEF